jgi:hypothetical protein
MGGLTNPLLDEINGLSPGAKAALMAAHGATSPVGTTAPNPAIGAAKEQLKPPSEAPPPALTLPSQPMPSTAGMGAPGPAIQAPRGTVTGDENERGRLLNSGTGIDQIQGHPFLKGIAEVADKINPFSAIPGTTAHHNLLLGRANTALTQDQANAEKQAQTQAQQAEVPLRQAQTEEVQNRPEIARQKIEAGLNEHGFTMGEDGKVVPLPYERMSEPQQAIHDLKASQEELADAGAALKKAQAAGIPAQVQMAQQRIATAQKNAQTAVGRLGLAGQALQFKHEEAEEKRDNPTAPPIAQGRAYQGRAIVESANDLKSFIDKNPEVFGNLDSYWNKFVNDTPISNPNASKAMAKLASFAALQPALHGMRSHDAMKEFERMIGGIPKNGESLKAAVDGLVESAAQPMIDVVTPHRQTPQPQGGGPPSGAQVIKWEDVK